MIEIRTRKVFFAPTKGRHFLTKKAAARAEAGARIARKYPTEKPDYLAGDHGFHWTTDERLRRVHKRFSIRLMRLAAASTASQPGTQSQSDGVKP